MSGELLCVPSVSGAEFYSRARMIGSSQLCSNQWKIDALRFVCLKSQRQGPTKWGCALSYGGSLLISIPTGFRVP